MKLNKSFLQLSLLALLFTMPFIANIANANQQTPLNCQWIADPDGDIICI
jgi:hypothetical protein